MRAVIQRVSRARVTIAGNVNGAIDRGLLVLLGVAQSDAEADVEWLADKIAALRIFEDEAGKMNLSVIDIGGALLVVSQFTLFASTRKGTRPSFNDAAKPEIAIPLYESFVRRLQALLPPTASGTARAATGVFGAKMDVELVNDGPVTLIIDSKQRE
jgi:D-tyrosyl-tRNA(Tyr) deacylase